MLRRLWMVHQYEAYLYEILKEIVDEILYTNIL